jgi:hypothetical protein
VSAFKRERIQASTNLHYRKNEKKKQNKKQNKNKIKTKQTNKQTNKQTTIKTKKSSPSTEEKESHTYSAKVFSTFDFRKRVREPFNAFPMHINNIEIARKKWPEIGQDCWVGPNRCVSCQ